MPSHSIFQTNLLLELQFLSDADIAVARTLDLRYAPLLFEHVVLPAAIRKSVRIDPKYDSYPQIRSPYRQ
ncbi:MULTISPECIES: hypothetical protein [unclassified Polynucleobacter]|uniref:hypothetical protein n=1 Tax=unclassified Polynucleobacter TaxID=2640945 RepID=UPI001C0A97B5|nr:MULTISPECIES: hypothetical protein [unclassified Polynucleobacter]MBU3590417.1 hypothetical protein [Polynucleobacter sp. 78F-HAINBA]MCX7237115.1 hypothetical protein [Polynucleobacter sp.]